MVRDMQKVISVDQLSSLFNAIRDSSRGKIYTNFFFDEPKHSRWIEEGIFFFKQGDGYCMLLKKNSNFYNLFYVTSSLEALKQALEETTFNLDVSTDIVTKGEGSEEINLLVSCGFDFRRRLFRMIHSGELIICRAASNIINATEADAKEIKSLLDNNFDTLSEQIPDIEEILDLIKENGVCLYKEGNAIKGLAISQIKGVSFMLRYWLVLPEARNKGIGSELLKASIDKYQSKKQSLWVVSNNDNAIKRYEHLGFRKDKLIDTVLVKKINSLDYERKDTCHIG